MAGFLQAWLRQLSVPFTDSVTGSHHDRPELKAFREGPGSRMRCPPTSAPGR